MLFAQVILPLPLENVYTYLVPEHLERNIGVGFRVVVPFGKRHYYTGIVEDISPKSPAAEVELKQILLVLDEGPIIKPLQLKFWHWLSDYYLCSVGDVFKAALPSGLKVESETQVMLSPEIDEDAFGACKDKELAVLEYVKKQGKTTAKSIEQSLKLPNAEAIVGRLIEKSLLAVSEKLIERYRAIKKPYVAPLIQRGDNGDSLRAFALVKNSPKQEEALVGLLALSEFHKVAVPLVEVPLEVLLERTGCTRANIKALETKGLCKIYNKEISRFSYNGPTGGALPVLSNDQQSALSQIHASFKGKDVVLLHGVTGSGKTEIYIHLIDFVLKEGKQALFLVPEIALTTQLTTRLQKVFGPKVLIYHSKFSDSERVELWRKLLDTKAPKVVIGVRSAVFLPFSHLGLVIVDEEHEASYKQNDPAPRYNGRDAATVLASMHGAKTLFGSATPTVETYHKAISGKFGLVELSKRFNDIALPAIEIVDMKLQRRAKNVEGFFSGQLVEAVSKSLEKKRQTIFFHNRRGFAPVSRCKMCDYTPHCRFCDVALTYHRRINRLQCHYCGSEYPVPEICPQCKEPAMEIAGYGTERLEDEIAQIFPDKRVLRMDLDTTRNKDGYSNIIDRFSAGEADILVGTQMVTKGLDFGGVEVVGLLNADSLINFPDFRSTERAFNMIEQVAGRAGRRNGDGKVIVQTYQPEHAVIRFAAAHDYRGFFDHELKERQAFNFPPFSRIINIYLRHRDPHTVAEAAAQYANALRNIFGARVLGPQEPPVARIQSLYIRKIMLKIETDVSMPWVKKTLRQEYINLAASPLIRSLTIHYDVDPV